MVAAAPMLLSPLPQLIALRPGIGCPPGIPKVALASPMPPQSLSEVMLSIELYPTRTSLISEELKTWLQLAARLRKGASVRPPRRNGNAVFVVLIVSSAIE